MKKKIKTKHIVWTAIACFCLIAFLGFSHRAGKMQEQIGMPQGAQAPVYIRFFTIGTEVESIPIPWGYEFSYSNASPGVVMVMGVNDEDLRDSPPGEKMVWEENVPVRTIKLAVHRENNPPGTRAEYVFWFWKKR